MKINKKLLILISILIIVTTLTACKKEPEQITEVTDTNKLAEIETMSKDLNNAMFTIKNMGELAVFFDGYMDKIGEQTYLNHFDVGNRMVALNYYTDIAWEEYIIREVITVEDGELTKVYIAYEVTGYADELPGSGETHGLEEVYSMGLNKYVYSNNKLVNFEKVL